MLGGLASAWLRQRTPVRRAAAWVLAAAGPALLTLGALPWRSSLILGGFLFSALLVVIMVAVIGGPPPALAAVGLSVLARVFLFAPPFEDRRADLQPNIISLAGFAVAGAAAALLIGKLGQLAGEQWSSQRIEAALRRAATLVARASLAEELFAAVTEEVGQVLSVDFARLARYEPDDRISIVAAWNRTGEDFPVGSRWPLTGENVSALVLRTGRPARIDNFAGASGPLSAKSCELGVRGVAGAPVIAEGRVWGVMIAGTRLKRALPPDTEASLASFTDLLATAISNADSRAALTRLAQEQAALQRVATLVARGAPPDELFAAVSGEVGRLLQAGQTAMIRYEPDGTAARVAAWSAAGGAVVPPWRERVGGRNLTTVVWQTGRPARVGSYADASGAAGAVARKAGFRSAVGTPIIVQGRLWGVMIAGSVSEQPLGPDTEARLASFTELVATAISNAENLAELTASRARVVATADETRRRIERDLHDGAQQRLVSLALALRAAQTRIPPQHAKLDSELGRVADGLASVLDDLQEMARGIHPAILAQGGLGPALKTLARRCTLPVVLDVRAVARLPEQVEVAAYYVISEALANAVKHARASVIHVEADTLEGALQLQVRDDGAGGADPTRGSGLLGLKDRVEALGGTITVHSPASAGTSLHAKLPLGR
jgi:signal transduction histidine kinase